MRHPHSLSERRHNRATIMARRRQILRLFHRHDDPFRVQDNGAWNKCAKFNLCCSCGACRNPKTRNHRNLLKTAVRDNIRSWDGDLSPCSFPTASGARRDRRLPW